MIPTLLETDRLILRPWSNLDLLPFQSLNGDPRVTEFFPRPLTSDESDRLAQSIMDHFQRFGWGFWAVEIKGRSHFIGFIGLRYADFKASFTPCIEVGWRLAFDYWGKGYATEGAQASLMFAFQTLQLPEVVSFTSAINLRSRRVMEKLGMVYDPKSDFENPKIEEGHDLRPCVLYRLTCDNWLSSIMKSSPTRM